MAPLVTGCVASEQTEEGASSGLADARTDGAGSDTLGEMYSSGTRIKMRLARTEGGAKSLMGWHDVQFETDCGFQEDVDGALRCFPVGTAIELNEVYADANCTVRAAMVNECSFSQGEHPEWAVVERSPSACGLRGLPLGYRRVTGYSEGPTYGREGSSCVVVAGNPNLRLSDTLVPYTEFAIATESVE